MIDVHALDTVTLGDRSYLATDGEVAIVVDPQRDIERVLALADRHDVTITHVAETHLHNDYLTGGPVLARRTGAEYLINADDRVGFARRGVRDGDVVEAGRMRVRVLSAPGHTFTHLAYVLEDAGAEGEGSTVAVFTGGSLLFGSTGRPDLLGPRHTETLARSQYATAHRLAAELPGSTAIYPTHGFGSFCSITPAAGSSSTIAAEVSGNPALTRDEDTYVAELLAGLTAYPAYYAHMAPRNAAGPGPVDLSLPRRADPGELRRRITAGEWVVDLRTRQAFAAGHLPGTFNIGLDGSFVTYLGWLLPWGTPVTLLGETAEAVATAQRELVRIGIDRPAAMSTGTPEDWCAGQRQAQFPRQTFAGLAREIADHGLPFVLDVRRDDERVHGALALSHSVPVHELPRRIGEVPTDRPVWVHCSVGYRASVAAAILERAGREVVLVDDIYARVTELPRGVAA